MIKNKRSKARKPEHLQLVSTRELPKEQPARRIEVPVTDTAGKPLEDWRTALWHLLCARNLFASAFQRTRTSDKPRADEFKRACAIVAQVDAVIGRRKYEAWDGENKRPIDVDRGSLAKMAHHCEREFFPGTTRIRVEERLLRKLPRTVGEARRSFPDHPLADEFNRDGATNLARFVLLNIASQGHDDALKVRRRWEVDSVEQILGSKQFAEDVDRMAADVRALLLGDASTTGMQLDELLIRHAYKVLALERPLEALDRKRRRSDLAKR